MPKLYGVAAMTMAIALIADRPAAAQTCPEVGFTLIEPKASAATRPVTALKAKILHVRREALTKTDDITEAKATGDKVDGELLLKFTPAAEARLAAATTNHAGVRIAFVAGDEALLAFTWEGPYGMDPGGSQISMKNGYDRARRLAETLQRCIGASGAP